MNLAKIVKKSSVGPHGVATLCAVNMVKTKAHAAKSSDFSPGEIANIQKWLQYLLDKPEYAQNQTHLARDMPYPNGKKMFQQAISGALGGQIGSQLARAIAQRVGISLEQCIKTAPVPGQDPVATEVPLRRWSDVAGWEHASDEVRREGMAPDYAIRGASDLAANLDVEYATGTLVYDVAMLWLHSAPLALRHKYETAAASTLRATRADASPSSVGPHRPGRNPPAPKTSK